MEKIYVLIRKRARLLVADLKTPQFYQKFQNEYKQSCYFSSNDPIVNALRLDVLQVIKNNLGHGQDHADKVSLDAGTLLLVEESKPGYSENHSIKKLRIAQCAGLLHDCKRTEKEHAAEGAVFARNFLETHPFSTNEIDDICYAIKNHEAFKEPDLHNSHDSELISNCLYDADKFRWGPDNFTHTIWDMLSFANVPLITFVDNYQTGMEAIEKIKNTFRTKTGKKYGSEFIEQGLTIGEKLYKIIQSDFSIYF